MAGLALARPAPPAVTVAPAALPGDAYMPGRCNIGADEIASRRRWGHAGVVATIALGVALVLANAPREARLMLFLPAAAAAVGYLQAWLRFCAAYGLLGIFNFGPLGRHERIADPHALQRDRRRAVGIALVSAAIGAAVALFAYLA